MFAHYLLLLLSASSMNAYPSGAPATACQTFIPRHSGAVSQPSQSLYNIEVGGTKLVQGNSLSVVITSDQLLQYQGFVVQARNPLAPREPLGTFTNLPNDAQTINCPPGIQNTVTHRNKTGKSHMEFEWQPPTDYIGTVIFNGTVLQDYNTFWAGVQSEPVQVVKRSLSGNDGQSAGISTTRRPKITTPSPTLRPESPTNDKVVRLDLTGGCGAGTKTCFGTPDGCIARDNCNALVTVDHTGTEYIFELYTNDISDATFGTYVAVGLSADTNMGDDSVVQCFDVAGVGQVKSSWNHNGYDNAATSAFDDELTVRNISVTNGNVYCKFARKPITTHNNVEFNLNTTPYYLLIARGPYGTALKRHTERLAAAQAILLSHGGVVGGASKVLLRLHAAFMITAWIGAASIGIVLARYFKQTWVGNQLCGKDQWFAWHRFFMLLTWLLTIVAFILIFVELKAWSSANNPHAILGTCTTILAFIQPFMAALRPDPSSPKRPIFNWLHWMVGNAAHILAIVTIFFATTLTKAEVPEWLEWIMVSYVAFHVLMHLVFSIIGCASEKSNGKRGSSFAMRDMGSSRAPLANQAARSQDAPNSTLRKILLGIYIVIIVLLTITIVVIAVMAPIEDTYNKIKNIIMP